MPLTAPKLDDRTFRDIVAEAKSLIPRYAPQWTNHNDSDPGIALVQLFAWMTDITLYRLNLVPERNYIKFLQLLGIELAPARPAATELTFALARDDIDHAIVPKGTPVAAAEPDPEGETIVFETDTSLIAISAKLTALQVYDGFSYSLVTTANQAGEQTFYPFGIHARDGSALLLGFESSIDFTDQQLDLAVFVHDAATTESSSCSLQLETLPLPATVVWEYWDGVRWQALTVDEDETQAFALGGHIRMRAPGKAIQRDRLGAANDTDRFWIRCRLERGAYETSPQLDTILTNTVRATQAVTVKDEVLGGSNGRPDQVFFLSQTPIVPLAQQETVTGAAGEPVTLTHVRLEVSERPVIGEDRGFQVWQEVDDFYNSGENDPHYTLNRTTGEIHFGDGRHGRIPIANESLPNSNIVARLYRAGGGKAGNVGANTLTAIQSYVPAIKEVTNPFAASGGSDEETLDEAKERAPQKLKSGDRAVTAEDFEVLAEGTPGVRVRRARALPRVHPDFPGAQIPGVVTVIVVPDSDSPRPTPSPRTLEAVCACLNQRRLLTAEVYVVPPVYRQVTIAAEVIVRPQDDLGAVRRAVEESLIAYFHPLTGGDEGLGWPFGQTIYFSRVYQRILQTPGVDRIDNNQLEIFLDNVAQGFCRDAPLPEQGDLLYSEEHEISVRYAP